MAVKASAEDTVYDQTDVDHIVLWHYPSTSAIPPARPATTTEQQAPPSGWSRSEPTVSSEADLSKNDYTSIQTVFGDGSCSWGDVTLSASFEAAKVAWNAAHAAQNAVDGLEVGGRNLVLATSHEPVTVTKASDSARVIKRYELSDFSAGVLDATTRQVVSFEARVSSGTWRVHPYAVVVTDAATTVSTVSGTYYATTEWQRFSMPMALSQTPTHIQVTANTSTGSSGVTYELRDLKLETGTKPTDWTPAPEDTDAAIATVEATYGTCSTEAATADKVVTCADFELRTGARVTVKFTTGNTTNAPTLNVNGTGDIAVWYNNAVAASSNPVRWGENASLSFVYDGTVWVLDEKPPSYSASCTTGASTRSKAATVAGALVVNGTTLTLNCQNGNTYTSNSVQVNLSSTGSASIYRDRAVTSSTNTLLWDANTSLTFVRQGAYWYLADNGTRTMSENAAKTATTYIFDHNDGGAMVHPSGDDTTGVHIDQSVDILRSGTSTAEFGGGTNGDTARVGPESGNHISVDSDSVDILKGSLYVAGFEGSSVEEAGPIATEKADTFRIKVGTSGDIDISATEYRMWENGEPEPEAPKEKEASFWIQGDSDETSDGISFDHSAGVHLDVTQGYGAMQLYGEYIGMSDPNNMDPEVQIQLGKPTSLYSTGNVSVANSSWVKVAQLTIPSTGTWLVVLSGDFASNATGRRLVACARGAVPSSAPSFDSQNSLAMAPANGAATKFSSSAIIDFTADDVYYAAVWQNSGGALTTRIMIKAVRLI